MIQVWKQVFLPEPRWMSSLAMRGFPTFTSCFSSMVSSNPEYWYDKHTVKIRCSWKRKEVYSYKYRKTKQQWKSTRTPLFQIPNPQASFTLSLHKKGRLSSSHFPSINTWIHIMLVLTIKVVKITEMLCYIPDEQWKGIFQAVGLEKLPLPYSWRWGWFFNETILWLYTQDKRLSV